MLFNSLEFAIFLPIVFGIYWLIGNRRCGWQNLFIVIASYVFYGWWDWRFLSLIIFSSFVDYAIGIALGGTSNNGRRRLLVSISLFANLGLLGVFKYYNFFAESFSESFRFFGQSLSIPSLSVILPVGISFYTFQTLSYTIDIYRRQIEPTRDLVAFFAFVSFFPQLVAGPIERASNLLPQFSRQRVFDYDQAVDGCRQILWGLFKKIVIADNCAIYVNLIFDSYTELSASTLLVGGVLFAFQIYGDFSGYSDIAIGTARLFGFNLRQNFAFPYFSRDIAEFWRRWHISLSTWFRDYVYIPLGGSRVSPGRMIRNIIIIFVVSGFWHGANWTFVIWGALNGIYFIPLMLFGRNRRNLDVAAAGKWIPSFSELFQIGCTFALTIIAWIFFRSENVMQALGYLGRMASMSMFSVPKHRPLDLFLMIGLLLVVEWTQRSKQHGLELNDVNVPAPLRWFIYYALVACIIWFGGTPQDFIYFQF